MAYSRRVFEAGYEGLVDAAFLRFADMVRVAPQLARLRADRSVYGAVSRFVKDERLRQALSFHALLVGGNPFDTSAIYTLIPFLEHKWGVFFPRGGTGALVRALADLYAVSAASCGSALRWSMSRFGLPAPGGRSTWCRLRAEALRRSTRSSPTPIFTTPTRASTRARRPPTPRARGSSAWTGRCRSWSSTSGRAESIRGAPTTRVLFGPRYREMLREIFHGPSLPPDFSLYLHQPTVTDPSLAPPGGETFYVLAPVPHLGAADIDWTTAAEPYADRILASLETLLPDLRREVVVKRIATPFDFRDRLNAYQGSAFSLAPRLTQSAYFRPHNRDPRIPGLYIVGAGTHPGAGVPGVINSAKATARLVTADLGLGAEAMAS